MEVDSNGIFDFSILPTVLNDIINQNVAEMTRAEHINIHKTHFNKSLSIIRQLKKTYDISGLGIGFICYRLDMDIELEIEIMGDANTVYVFPVETENQYNELVNIIDNEEHIFITDFEGYVLSDEEEETDIEMEIDL